MKILLVTFSDNADHQDITFGMFESLYKACLTDFDVYVMGIESPKVSVIDTPNTQLVDCPRRPGIEKKTFDLFELHKIVSWINKQNFDVIFFETLHVWNLAIMKFCHKNTKIFQMIHDLIPHEGDKQAKSVHLMNKAVCKLSDYIVLANQKYVPKVTEIYGVDPKRVRYVDMWRRFPDYSSLKHSKSALFFGRMNPYKGIDNLLEIAKSCPNIDISLVGRVDDQVKDIVNKLVALPNITLNTGYVSNEEMEKSFVNADCIILPYNSATQSGVIVDAYRYGRPCVAFNVGAISEQVIEGVTGYLIEPGNNVAFAQKLNDVINLTDSQLEVLSKAAYDYGLKKYSAEGAVERFISLVCS